MKKLIVAAAGLMLAGAMVTPASAVVGGVTFNSDARARGQYFSGYKATGVDLADGTILNDSDTSNWNSRVRLKAKAETKGGAYAIVRIRMADAKWDGTKQTRALGEGSNIYTDYAYIGSPLGDSSPVSIEAGLLPFNITKWSVYDVRVDGVHVKYASDMTTVVGFYHKTDEYEQDALGVVVPYDIVNDDDKDRYGVLVDQKFDGGWGVIGSIWMSNNDQAQTVDQGIDDGVGVAAEVTGTAGNVGILGDFAWYEGDLVGLPDDPLGFYVQAAIPVGPASIAVGGGYTMDGFVADGDFGPFIMLSDVSNIATGIGIGTGGDTTFGAVVPSFQVAENLQLVGCLAYADIDGILIESAFEASGALHYTLVEGALLTAEAGYLDIEGYDDPMIGAGVSMDIAF